MYLTQNIKPQLFKFFSTRNFHYIPNYDANIVVEPHFSRQFYALPWMNAGSSFSFGNLSNTNTNMFKEKSIVMLMLFQKVVCLW